MKMIVRYIDEIFYKEEDKCYQPTTWDVLEENGVNATIKNTLSHYKEKSGQKVLIEANVPARFWDSFKRYLKTQNFRELDQDYKDIKEKRSDILASLDSKERTALDQLE